MMRTPVKTIAIFSAFFLLLLFLIIKLCINQHIYSYDASADYLYDFNGEESNRQSLSLANNNIPFNCAKITNQSAFLRLKIKTTLLGRIFQPSITLNNGHTEILTHLEPNANGYRYINISSFSNSECQGLTVKLSRATLADNLAEVVSFNNDDLSTKKILIISPHPDDAEIAAYGLYSSHRNVTIVTVTAGEAGSFKYNEIYPDLKKNYLKTGQLRTWNSLTIPLLAGITSDKLVNLGYFDSTLSKMYKDKQSIVEGKYTKTTDITTFRKQNNSMLAQGLSGESNWTSYVKNLEYILHNVNPDIIITPHPQLDFHPDHKFSSIGLFEAIKNLGIHTGEIYFYTNHLTQSDYYPFGEIGESVTLPPSVGARLKFRRIFSHPISE
jgi:hypothetical protein